MCSWAAKWFYSLTLRNGNIKRHILSTAERRGSCNTGYLSSREWPRRINTLPGPDKSVLFFPTKKCLAVLNDPHREDNGASGDMEYEKWSNWAMHNTHARTHICTQTQTFTQTQTHTDSSTISRLFFFFYFCLVSLSLASCSRLFFLFFSSFIPFPPPFRLPFLLSFLLFMPFPLPSTHIHKRTHKRFISFFFIYLLSPSSSSSLQHKQIHKHTNISHTSPLFLSSLLPPPLHYYTTVS